MASTSAAQASMMTIDRFIQEVGAAKTAQDKSAETAHTEPGSIGGETSHPVKSVDDRCEDAKEGERSAENTADVKADQGKPSVDSTPEGQNSKAAFDLSRFAKPAGRLKQAEEGKSQGGLLPAGSAADDQLQIGTNKQPTGEDPSVETGSAKAGKEDPGSSHPARTDNDSLDGHKYSADQFLNLPIEQLFKMASDTSQELCDELTAEMRKSAAAPSPTQKQAAAPSDAQVAHQAGWELAGAFHGDMDKQAVDALVQERLAMVIKTAADDADQVAAMLDGYFQQKQAESAEEGGGDDSASPPSEAAAEEPPAAAGPESGADGGAGAGGGEEAMLAALGGPGGADPAAAGGDPAAGGGGDLGVEELAQILQELGITPEEFEAAMAAMEGGAGGPAGAPPAAPPAGGPPPGGPPPAGMPGMGGGMEAMAADGAGKGNRVKGAHDGVREYIQEVISRSRRAKQ